MRLIDADVLENQLEEAISLHGIMALALGLLWVISYFNHKINDLDCKITELRLKMDRQPIPRRTTYASYSDLKRKEERERYEKQWQEAHKEFDSWDLDLEDNEDDPEIDKLKE